MLLFVLHLEAAPCFSSQLAALLQELKNPKSFVNLEVKLLKSIFSGLCKHYEARTEVQKPQMHRVSVLLWPSDAAESVTSGTHCFLSNSSLPELML